MCCILWRTELEKGGQTNPTEHLSLTHFFRSQIFRGSWGQPIIIRQRPTILCWVWVRHQSESFLQQVDVLLLQGKGQLQLLCGVDPAHMSPVLWYPEERGETFHYLSLKKRKMGEHTDQPVESQMYQLLCCDSTFNWTCMQTFNSSLTIFTQPELINLPKCVSFCPVVHEIVTRFSKTLIYISL